MFGKSQWPSGNPIDINMDKETLGRRRRLSPCKNAQFPSDAGRSEPRDTQPSFHRFREGNGTMVSAASFNNKTDGCSIGDIEQALFDQPGIHRRIEPTIINDVVDVPIGIIVHPARRNRADRTVRRPAHTERPEAGNAAMAAGFRPGNDEPPEPKRGGAAGCGTGPP
jgi:hypothetical protein